MIICFSYTVIGREAHSGPSNDSRIRKNKQKLQMKIGLIILTDFLCWIPFIAVCYLHYSELIDATSWYTNFSIIILPINSTINPLLYHSIFQEFGEDIYKRVSSVIFAKKMSASQANWFVNKIDHLTVPSKDKTDEEAKEEEMIELIEHPRN
jgi:hypothetical protein